MSSQFQRIGFSLRLAEAELVSFKAWLSSKAFLIETEIVKELRVRQHMCCLLAAFGAIPAPDLIKFELSLQGVFRTDLVVGNDALRQFVLIEFEDAKENSIFSSGSKQYRHWSSRLEHGIGQVVDWAWLRADAPSATLLTNAFGGVVNDSAYVVICGRDASLHDEMERRRFDFRRNRMQIAGTRLQVLTYDDMIKAMESQLQIAKTFSTSP